MVANRGGVIGFVVAVDDVVAPFAAVAGFFDSNVLAVSSFFDWPVVAIGVDCAAADFSKAAKSEDDDADDADFVSG